MAAIVLSTAGRVAGSALGGPIGGAIGGLAGGLVGGLLDRALFGPSAPRREGPRLDDLQLMASTEGAPIPRPYGRMKLGCQVIWPENGELEQVIATGDEGGKGGTGEAGTTEYSYFASFAVALCEGEVPEGLVIRAWADGQPLDLSALTWRFYPGSETQAPDSLIETAMGAGETPAYRGTCYVVFERMPLAAFGNHVPQLTFEAIRPTPDAVLEGLVTGVNMIPGTTEHGYDPEPVKRGAGEGEAEEAENTHNLLGLTDFVVSADHLQAILPNVESVCLVVAWFGADLRAGDCTVRPKVESATKTTDPDWASAGLTRSTAQVVSQVDGRPAFGGTPDDEAVKRAIQYLKNERGLRVMLYPFIMMDIESGNALPNPYSDNAATNGQPVYPWRGRITCSPAAGYVGTVDKSATAGTQVSSFVGSATPGPTEWSFRRMILHYAQLCDDAGGVDAFCIGTEMVGLTQVRSDADTYPFVDALIDLAADVRAIVGGSTLIGYAADWSEYHSHRPADGSGDVFFNLDPLWSDPEIDFVGIDHYLPLADWRDGVDHLDYDAAAGHTTTYELSYLQSRIEGGEYFDWFYADASARAAQTRTPIVDTAEGKDWVFRQKDFRSWWSEAHYDRPGGVENGSPTGWTPEGKPIVFTEVGCPAVDKGANQPNVFFDPKSSESFVPYFSHGTRDDVIQRQYLTALLSYWADDDNNPASGVYAGRMIDVANTHVWAWDARPYPTFPLDRDAWADFSNWQYGHWISGRAGLLNVPDMMADLASRHGFDDHDFSRAFGACDGYLIDGVMSLRDAFEPLATFFHFDLLESAGKIVAATRLSSPVRATLTLDDILAGEGPEPVELTRGQESELPLSIKLHHLDAESDYRATPAEARRATVASRRIVEARVPIAIDRARGTAAAEAMLNDAWAGLERGSFGLMPRHLALEPADVVAAPVGEDSRELRLEAVEDAVGRRTEARSFERAAFLPAPTPVVAGGVSTILKTASPALVFMDLPLLKDTHDGNAGYLAAAADPWPGGVNVYRSPDTSGYELNRTVRLPASIGVTLGDFYSGPVARWDYGNSLYLRISRGTLASAGELALFEGANAIAVENADGEWEIMQFKTAALTAPKEYLLTQLLRGQRGSESAMRSPVASGARIVVLSNALAQAAMVFADINRAFNWRYGPAGKAIGDATYKTAAHTFLGIGLKPYAPVHVKGVRDGSDNIAISWTRQTRIGGDGGWEAGEVPLGESSERYEVEILDGVDVVRTQSASSPAFVYSAAQQMTDFGGLPSPLDVIVYQVSPEYGRGWARAATLYEV